MKISQSTQNRITSAFLTLAGVVFLAKFAFYTPGLLNPYLTMLIASLLFGPGVIKLWKAEDDEDK